MEGIRIVEIKELKPAPVKGGKKSLPKLDVFEHVRRFNLPQSFPSSIKSSKNVTAEKIITSNPPPLTASISKEIGNQLKVSNTLQKLRIQSADGKGIREINVQVLPQNELLMRNIRIPKNALPPVNKPRQNIQIQNVRSIAKQSENDKTGKVVQTLKDGMIKPVNTPQPNGFRSVIQYPPARSVQTGSQKINTQTSSGILIPVSANSDKFVKHQVPIINDNNQNSNVFVVQNGHDWQMIKLGNNNNRPVNQTQPVLNVNPGSAVPANSSSANIQTGNMNKISVKPITLDINTVKGLKSLSADGMIKIANPRIQQTDNNKLKKRQNSTEQFNNVAKKRYISDSTGSYQSVIDENQLMSILQDESTSAIDIAEYTEDMRNDTIVVLPAEDMCRIEAFERNNFTNKTIAGSTKRAPRKKPYKKVKLIGNDSGTINRTECDSTNSPAPNEVFEIQDETITNKSSSTTDKNILGEKDMSDQLNIVGKALQSIEDEELREKALKALADCGIGLERLIPTKPPPDKTAIADSSTQTKVFGLFQTDEFLQVSESNENIIRTKEKTHNEVQHNESSTEQSTNRLEAPLQEDMDKMVSRFCKNPKRVDKVNEIMKCNPMIDKTYRLWKEDLNNAKKYDNDGTLNIHKAVLSNQAKTVKRQLIILRACKLDVDVPTKTGETALELAIQYQVKTEIVQLLLKANASPTSSKSVHDSALTIACQQQTPLIPLLIEHVKKPEELNQMDSTGFAAIHYCTQNGNSEAVSLLLKAGADLNLRDHRSGRTPIFHALENEHIGMTRELLQRGAKPNIQNRSGHNVFSLYDEMRHFNLKDLLTKSTKT